MIKRRHIQPIDSIQTFEVIGDDDDVIDVVVEAAFV